MWRIDRIAWRNVPNRLDMAWYDVPEARKWLSCGSRLGNVTTVSIDGCKPAPHSHRAAPTETVDQPNRIARRPAIRPNRPQTPLQHRRHSLSQPSTSAQSTIRPAAASPADHKRGSPSRSELDQVNVPNRNRYSPTPPPAQVRSPATLPADPQIARSPSTATF
jgi:hypothetical protein